MVEPTETKVTAEQHESFWTFTLIAIVIPAVAIILGIVYLTKDQKVDRKLGEHLIAFGIFAAIIQSALLYLFVPSFLAPGYVYL